MGLVDDARTLSKIANRCQTCKAVAGFTPDLAKEWPAAVKAWRDGLLTSTGLRQAVIRRHNGPIPNETSFRTHLKDCEQ